MSEYDTHRSKFDGAGSNDIVAGCKMPSNHSISLGDINHRRKCEIGSDKLLRAIQGYIENNHPRCDG